MFQVCLTPKNDGILEHLIYKLSNFHFNGAKLFNINEYLTKDPVLWYQELIIYRGEYPTPLYPFRNAYIM